VVFFIVVKQLFAKSRNYGFCIGQKMIIKCT